MTILRNKSGGVSTLYAEVGAANIPDDGDFDTSTIIDGQPVVLPALLQSSSELLAAIRAGDWCVVIEGEELSPADSEAALTPSSVSGVDTATGGGFSNPWRTLSPNPGDGVWVDLPGCEWTVSDDQSWGAVVNAHVEIGGKPGGSVVRLTIIKDGVATASMEDESDRFGRIPGFDIRAERIGSTATVQLKRKGAAAVRVWTHGSATGGTL